MICGGILPENAKSDMTKKKDTAEVQNGYEKKRSGVTEKSERKHSRYGCAGGKLDVAACR